jgi:DNA modification methylase
MIWLQQGDCLELMKNIPDGSVDMILCDLPYGTTACKWDTIIPFEPLWEQYERIIKDNGAIVLTASQPFTTKLIMSKLDWFRYTWVWNKKKAGNIFLAKKQPMKIHEDIVVFSKKPHFYNPQMVKRDKVKKSKNYGTGESFGGTREKEDKTYTYTHTYPKSIIEFSNAIQKGKVHPTQKPVPLLEYLIKTYTRDGETVLDNCMGSGSTGVACVNLKRNFIGIELEEKYFKIAEERINNARHNQQTGGD